MVQIGRFSDELGSNQEAGMDISHVRYTQTVPKRLSMGFRSLYFH